MGKLDEIIRLKRLAETSGGYIAKLCPVCHWWQCEGGNAKTFEQDYCPDIRCKCKGGK